MISTMTTKQPTPQADPGSVPFDQLPEAIQRDIEEALRHGQEYSKRMRAIVEAEALRKTTDRPVIKQFSELFSETIKAVKLSDPTLTHDEAFARSWDQTRLAARAVRLSDPSTTPVPVPPAFDELQDNLDRSAADYAVRTSITNQPKPPKPQLNHHYAAAINLISQSNPPLERDAAYKLVKEARAKDLAELNAANAANSNPSPSDAWSKVGT